MSREGKGLEHEEQLRDMGGSKEAPFLLSAWRTGGTFSLSSTPVAGLPPYHSRAYLLCHHLDGSDILPLTMNWGENPGQLSWLVSCFSLAQGGIPNEQLENKMWGDKLELLTERHFT